MSKLQTAGVYPLTIYYESACALCNAEMSNLMLRNTEGLLEFIDVSASDFDALPTGTRMEDLLALIHAVQADGTVIKGVDVFRHAYRAVGLDWVTRGLELPVLGTLADRLYPWVARNRHQIPRPLVKLLFETAIRRAAHRAAERARCTGGACRS